MPGAEAAETSRAPRWASHALAFGGHALAFGLVTALLALVAGPLATTIVAFSWGLGLALHGYFAVAAPLLRAPLERHAAKVLPAPPPARPTSAAGTQALAAALAHEIRSPITAARSLAQQVAEDPTSAEAPAQLALVIEELDRVERSVAHLLRFAKEEPMSVGDVELGGLVERALAEVRDRADRDGVRLEVAGTKAVRLRGDAELLRRLVVNLLTNALDALAERARGAPAVELDWGTDLAGREAWLAVRDNGPGFDEAARARAFDPFFTKKRGGTGLGLALAKKTAEGHGGTLEIGGSPAGGAELLLTLPLPTGAT